MCYHVSYISWCHFRGQNDLLFIFSWPKMWISPIFRPRQGTSITGAATPSTMRIGRALEPWIKSGTADTEKLKKNQLLQISNHPKQAVKWEKESCKIPGFLGKNHQKLWFSLESPTKKHGFHCFHQPISQQRWPRTETTSVQEKLA